MTPYEAILLIVQVLTFVVLVFYRSFFLSYLTKKGENLATKEDIEEITRKTERIRASLQLLTDQQLNLREKEQESFLSFFEACLILLGEKIQQSPGDFPVTDIDKRLLEYQESVEHLFSRIYTDYLRQLLYFQGDSSLMQAAQEVLLASVETRKAFKQHFGKVKLALLRETRSYSDASEDKVKARTQETDRAAKEYYAAMKPCKEKLFSAFEGYIASINEYFLEKGGGAMPQALLSLAEGPV